MPYKYWDGNAVSPCPTFPHCATENIVAHFEDFKGGSVSAIWGKENCQEVKLFVHHCSKSRSQVPTTHSQEMSGGEPVYKSRHSETHSGQILCNLTFMFFFHIMGQN